MKYPLVSLRRFAALTVILLGTGTLSAATQVPPMNLTSANVNTSGSMPIALAVTEPDIELDVPQPITTCEEGNTLGPDTVYLQVHYLEEVNKTFELGPGECKRLTCYFEHILTWCNKGTGNMTVLPRNVHGAADLLKKGV
ncbi:unnamed protein product [Discula destructiva]